MARYAWVGLESSFGQPAASGKFMDIASEDLRTVHDWILPETAGRREKRVAIPGQLHVEGGIDVYVAPEGGIGEILKALLGSVSTETPSGATNARLHTFLPADSIPSLTIDVCMDDVATRRFLGCVLGSVEFSIAPGEVLAASLDITGKKEESGTAQNPTFTELPPFAEHQAVVTLGGSSVKPRALSLTISNELEPLEVIGDRYYAGIPVKGLTVEGSMDLIFENTNQLDKFLNGTETSMAVEFIGGEIESGFNYKLKFELPRVIYKTHEAGVDRRELLVESIDFEALYDATAGYLIRVQLQNTESGY